MAYECVGGNCQEAHPLPPLVRLADWVHADDDAAILVALVQHDLTCRSSAARTVGALPSAAEITKGRLLQGGDHAMVPCETR